MTISNHMARGAAWMVSIRWCVRALDVVTMIILARLLTADDFGIFATGMLIVSFLEVLTQAGIDIALIRNSSATREHYDAAWTIQIMQGMVVTLGLIVMAPIIGNLFNDNRVILVIQLLALRPFIQSFTNIGVVRFLKELDYKKEFWFGLYNRSSTIVVTLVLALFVKSYWAMVIGVIAGSIIVVIVSYRMHSYRPRLSFVKVREIWSFSVWILVYYAAEDLVEKTDRFVVGSISTSASLGQYHVGWSIAYMPLDNLVVPLWKALVPVYAKQTHDHTELMRTYLNVLGLTALVSFAAGFGTVAVAEQIVVVVLGEKWLVSVPYVQWLAIVPAIAGIVDSALMIISVTGHARMCALHSCIRLGVLVLILPMVGIIWGAEQVAIAYLFTAIALMPISFFMLIKVVPVSAVQIMQRTWRPVASGLIMLLMVKSLHSTAADPSIITLIRDLLIAGSTYLSVNIVLWLLSGRPEGAESILQIYFSRKIGAVLNRPA